MNQTFSIAGMHCQSCIGKVQATLESLPEVDQADVTLAPDQAVVELREPVSEDVINAALQQAGNYSVDSTKPQTTATDQSEPKAATYFPILLILAYLTGISVWTFWESQFDLSVGMATFMGGFFLVFSFFKFLDLSGFAQSFSSYDVIAGRWTGFGYVYPFVELALGIAYVVGLNPLVTNSVTVFVMSVGTVGVVKSLLHKKQIQCACLGTVFNLPMSKVTLIEDLLMVLMALAMLILEAM